MSETREQFRKRMHDVGYDGAVETWGDENASEYAASAMAGYAAALRDYRQHLIGMGYDYWVIRNLEKFAAERGINLERE